MRYLCGSYHSGNYSENALKTGGGGGQYAADLAIHFVVCNEKAAPGLCSVLVTVTGMLGGIWMPVDTLGGKILAVSKALPFYYGVKAARTMDAKALIITITAAVFAVMAAVVVLGKVWKKSC